jgi:hypothetical protein
MGVEGSRGGGAMSQVFRAEAQGDTRLEQMGRPGVSQGVDTSPLGDAALSQGSAEGVLHAGAGHGRGSRCQTRSPAAWSGEDPERIARGAPGAASKRKELLGQGAIAVLGPCALAAMAAPARRVNVAHRPMGAFLKPQTASRDGGEAAAVAGEPPAGEESTSRRGAEDDRAFRFPWGSDAGQRGPLPSHGVRRKKRDAAEGAGTGTARVVCDVLERAEVLTQLFRRDELRGLVSVLGQRPNGSARHLLGPFGQASEWQVGDQPWAQWGHGAPSCMCRGMDGDVQAGASAAR